jgi:tetratricopeptide (TPR) repeat protein
MPVATAPTPTPLATPQPTPLADDKSQSAMIVERFLNPKTTDQVKEADWQTLLTSTYAELSRDPSNAGLKAQAEFAQGQLHYLKGNLASARAAFLNANEASSDYALASYGLGQVYIKTEQPQLAVEALRRAVRLNPKLAIAHKLLGDVLRDLKKPEESATAYAHAYELGYLPSNTNLNSLRDLVKSKRCADAAELVRGLAAEPSSAEGYILLGDCYIEKNERVNAFEAYKDATTRDPNSPLAFYKLATIQFRERKFEAAQAALKRAEELDPNGRVIDHRGRNMVKETEDIRRSLKKRFPTLTVPKP